MMIGLVNNASDHGFKATERQFCNLLRAAAPGTDLQFRLYTCPGIPRSGSLHDIGGLYSDIRELPGTPLDALIVTGMEPQASFLLDEPVWSSLVHVADWAEENAVPTIWSCLAAHAVVLHRAAIARTRLADKLSGVFECSLVAGRHPLTRGLPPRWSCPHSRFHGLPEDLLTAGGYQILSRSDEAGADIFLEKRDAPFIFFQGHPEYEDRTLLGEYKRDIRRYVAGERTDYPASPQNYFDAHTDAALARLRDRAVRHGEVPALSDVVGIVNGAACAALWQPVAARLVSNFLAWALRDAGTCSPVPKMADGEWQGAVR
jgi:homoserine O-succinyltransferase